MKILFSSDTHVYPSFMARLLKAAEQVRPDAVIFGGDLIPDWRGSIQESIEPHRNWVREQMLPLLRDFHSKHGEIEVLLDFGNDDLAAAYDLASERDGEDFHLLHMRVVALNDNLAVVGFMNVNPTPFLIKDREKADCRDQTGLSAQGVAVKGFVTATGGQIHHLLDVEGGTLQDDLDGLSRTLMEEAWNNHSFIFVSHAPPKDTVLDYTSSKVHVGSLAVRRFIEKWAATGRLVATLHGHIHESPWMTGGVWQEINGAPCFNVGQKGKILRALWFDTERVRESARLVLVDKGGATSIMERNQWNVEQ